MAVGLEHVAWGVTELLEDRITGGIKVLLALVLSPMIGFTVGFMIHRTASRMLQGARPRVNTYLRRAQWISAQGWPSPTAPMTHKKAWVS